VKPALLLVSVLLVPALAAAEGASSGVVRQRFDPGLGVAALTDVRAYEGLDGAGSAVGVRVGYVWDLVGVHASYLQGLATVGERRPSFVKAGFDFAFLTVGRFSVIGVAGLDLVLHGPDRQTAAVNSNLWGPELGLGARFRVIPKLDLFASGTAGVWAATHGPTRTYFEPGVVAGVQFHPFAAAP
jgi:hypothetical protein